MTSEPLASLAPATLRRLALTNPPLEAFVREPDPTVDALAVYLDEELTLGQDAAARRVRSVAHSDQYFRVLGLRPLAGQLPDRTRPDYDSLAVVSYPFWQQHLAGEPDAVAGPLHSLLSGIVGHNLRVFAVVTGVLLVVSTTAAWVPARRPGPDGCAED